MIKIDKFQAEMLKLGVVSSEETETLWEISKRCTRFGIPLAGAGAAMMGKAGTVLIPGVGTVSGALAGALAGFVSGTASCVMLNVAYRRELRNLATKSSVINNHE